MELKDFIPLSVICGLYELLVKVIYPKNKLLMEVIINRLRFEKLVSYFNVYLLRMNLFFMVIFTLKPLT